nr:RDD family protein [uncultured Flavobacterium sp.]
MNYISINSSQNVDIQFTSANLFQRILAFFIDNVIISLYLYFILHFGSDFLEKINVFSNSKNEIILLFVLCLPAIFYTLIFESFFSGQTLGKFVMKIKVIKIDGFQANFMDYLIRWMFRLIDIFALSGMIAIFSILVSKKNQRLGEIASGTATISLKQNYNLKDTILTDLEQDYKPVFTQVVLLSDNDMRIIKENFLIAKKNKNNQTLVNLSEKLQEVLKLENPYKTHSEFIATIIKDYNYYTQYN